MSNSALVSIVLLNWNGNRYIFDCIQSIQNQEYRSLEVIVVDNGSTDGSIEAIRREHPDFKYIINSTNLGYAKGMNLGIEKAQGEYVIPLNFDVYLESSFISRCVDRMEGQDTLGAIGGRVFAWTESGRTNALRKGEGELTYLRKRIQGMSIESNCDEAYVFAANGSFPFIRKAALEDIKGIVGYYYDERFVTGWEDTDLWFRLHHRGWQVLFFAAAYGWHVGSGSVGGKAKLIEKSQDYQKRIFRNREYVIKKNIGGSLLRYLFPYLVLAELALVPYYLLKSPRSLSSLFGAWREVHINRKIIAEDRDRILSNSVLSFAEARSYFKKF